MYVISDEVYDHLVYDGKEYPSVLSCCSDLDHVMVISSFSKTFSMAGMRIGWLMASQGAIKKLRRYHMFTTTVANTPCQWAGVAALRGEAGTLRAGAAEAGVLDHERARGAVRRATLSAARRRRGARRARRRRHRCATTRPRRPRARARAPRAVHE